MKNLKVWIAFLAVFTCGALVGVTGVSIYIQSYFVPPKDIAKFEQQMHDRLLQEIIDEVRPDAKEVPAISSILREQIRELGAIKREIDPKVREVFRKNKKSIKEHLTPEQTERFDEMDRKRKGKKGGLFKLPPPPPPR